MSMITIGMGLAKCIFAVHGVNESAHTELVKLKFITPCRMFGRCGKSNAQNSERYALNFFTINALPVIKTLV